MRYRMLYLLIRQSVVSAADPLQCLVSERKDSQKGTQQLYSEQASGFDKLAFYMDTFCNPHGQVVEKRCLEGQSSLNSSRPVGTWTEHCVGFSLSCLALF
ncbi:hypothetical protein T265_11535 [Opisthorchis viverrini]|uniref:Secreted protein n=1 Tax=Opisthorchis viverrini TaxID=6198 RepID=A0A074Z964_OPIVI|nr:hypothetical protein T265_11535 [Opisthorchis viverrini]KER19770.1 hypothetical protein T265_11535 [Opisthorchis viverrini]